MLIKELKAFPIKDSRNKTTIGVIVNSEKASAPSGKSTGKYETPPYGDSIEASLKALNRIKFNFEINSFNDLAKVEAYISNKYHLNSPKEFGANALFALESAILKALAKSQKKQLWQIINPKLKDPKIPIPIGNIIGGGLHSHEKNHPTFQEFLIIPKGKSAYDNFMIMQNLYHKIKKHLKADKLNDEGAIETSLNEESIFNLLDHFSEQVKLGTDIAASCFHKDYHYLYNKKTLSRDEQIDYINSLISRYNLFYIEDPLEEEDFMGFKRINRDSNHLVVGDDLTATQISRLKKAIKNKSINAIIIKPNQNGSLLELQEIFNICKKNSIKTILSHRSGETLDVSLADYSVGFQTDFIKAGIATKWREVKLRRLIEIEDSLT